MSAGMSETGGSSKRPFVLCLTGSLGMGKSTAARFFAEEGVSVHDSDAVVHALYEGEAVAAIEQAFPGSTSDGKVDRMKLAARVLNDAEALARLEAIVHPLVGKARDEFLAEQAARGAAVVVLDIPLLFEARLERCCDAVVVVSTSAELQRRRVLERPGMTDEKFLAILGKQTPDEEKRRRADFIVDSSYDFDRGRAQVRDILRTVAKMQSRRQ
jgi:dephospho-CoA kinase